MDAVSYSHSAKQAQRIEKFIKNPDSVAGLVSVPNLVPVGETITIPSGRTVVHPNLKVDGTLTVDGTLFIPSGGTYSATEVDATVVKQNGSVVADDSAVVHKTGDETVAGVKTFSSSPIVPTPTAGNSSTKVATTAFVKVKGVEYSTVDPITTSISLTSGYFGALLFLYSGIAQNVNLPLVSQCPSGTTFTLTNHNIGTWFLNRAGTDTIFMGEVQVTSIPITAGATVTVTSRGDYWVVASGNVNTLGYGQVWTNLTGLRALGTAYTNTTGRPIAISVSAKSTIDSIFAISGIVQTFVEANKEETLSCIIPNNATYMVSISEGTTTVAVWAELR